MHHSKSKKSKNFLGRGHRPHPQWGGTPHSPRGLRPLDLFPPLLSPTNTTLPPSTPSNTPMYRISTATGPRKTLLLLATATVHDLALNHIKYRRLRSRLFKALFTSSFCHAFLRATAYAVSAHMLSQFRPSVCLSVRPSVRLSVTRVDQSKTVEVRIMQFSLYSSPIPLVFPR